MSITIVTAVICIDHFAIKEVVGKTAARSSLRVFGLDCEKIAEFTLGD